MTESDKQEPDKKETEKEEPSLPKPSPFSKSILPKPPPPQYVKRGGAPFGKEDPNQKLFIEKVFSKIFK